MNKADTALLLTVTHIAGIGVVLVGCNIANILGSVPSLLPLNINLMKQINS